jgi:hypothetical protein
MVSNIRSNICQGKQISQHNCGYPVKLPVSLFTAAIVDRHCGAKTNQAKSESAVGRLHCWEMIGISASEVLSALPANA